MNFINLGSGQNIAVCGIKELPGYIGACRQKPVVLSIENPGATPATGKAPNLSGQVYAQKVQVYFDITEEVRGFSPTPKQIDEGLDFLREHPDRDLIVHCERGVSRSAAMAALYVATVLGDGHEDKVVEELHRIRPTAAPNPFIVLSGGKEELAKALVLHDAIYANMGAAHRYRLDWMAANKATVEQHFGGRMLAPLHEHLRTRCRT
jgi:predicted protein tyrosine phosphatase